MSIPAPELRFQMYPPVDPGPYPKAMESAHNKAIFDAMYAIKIKLSDAMYRCYEVEQSERLMGYNDYADTYHAMIEEFKDVKLWIEKYMQGLLELA